MTVPITGHVRYRFTRPGKPVGQKTHRTDSNAFVINESAAKYMGLQHPVGTTIHWKNEWLNVGTNFRIIGVIRDMFMQSPYDPVKPTIFRLGANPNWMPKSGSAK